MKDVTGKFTTDLIGTTGYGLKVNSLKDPDAEFRKAGEHFARISTWRGFEMVSMFFLPEIGNLMGFQFFPEKTAKFLDEAFWGTINERIKSGIKRHDLIDLMIELRKKQQETGDYGEFSEYIILILIILNHFLFSILFRRKKYFHFYLEK